MLLPNLETIPTWGGHRSLGAFLIDMDFHDRETHATEHKILKDLTSGQRVSIPRIEKLFAAILRKWQPCENQNQGELDQTLRNLRQGDAPYLQLDFKWQVAMPFWSFLAHNLPQGRENTRKLLEGFIQNSLELHKVYHESGCQNVALMLRRLAAHSSAGPVQGRFLSQMAELFNEEKEVIARAELAAFGALYLSAIFLHESVDLAHKSDDLEGALRDNLTNLFAVHRGSVNPLKSFSVWLERLEQRTGYTKNKLLWDGFVRRGVEADKPAEQDRRSLLRNPRRYRSGERVPSFYKTQACLRALCPELENEEHARWKAELEHREFGVLFVLLVSNSARSIKKIGGVPERPCQAVFDLIA